MSGQLIAIGNFLYVPSLLFFILCDISWEVHCNPTKGKRIDTTLERLMIWWRREMSHYLHTKPLHASGRAGSKLLVHLRSISRYLSRRQVQLWKGHHQRHRKVTQKKQLLLISRNLWSSLKVTPRMKTWGRWDCHSLCRSHSILRKPGAY